MELKTIYFLQALWDVDVQKEKITKLAKQAMISEINNRLAGSLHEQTLWLSYDAMNLRNNVEKICSDAANISQPGDLIRINDEFRTVCAKIQAMQMKTMRAVVSTSGLLMKDVNILCRQLIPVAQKNIRKQCRFQLYRAMLLNGNYYPERVAFPQNDYFKDWYLFYEKEIQLIFDTMDTNSLDARWAYERKEIKIGNIYIEQYIAVEAKSEEINQILGVQNIGMGNEGGYRIAGRGWITNITPGDIENLKGNDIITSIPSSKYMMAIGDENCTPQEVLSRCFSGKFLISPNDYFEFINLYIITKSFSRRINLSQCIRCGEPRYSNVCPKCGRLWVNKEKV